MAHSITNSEELRDLINSDNLVAVLVYGDGHKYDIPYESLMKEFPGLEFALLHSKDRSIREEFRIELRGVTFYKNGKWICLRPRVHQAFKEVYDRIIKGEDVEYKLFAPQ